MLKTSLLAACACLLSIAPLFAQSVSDNTVVVGNPAQPVQWEHRGSIQDAINRAGPAGTVWIPASYAGTDCNPIATCNPGTTQILDWRPGGVLAGVVVVSSPGPFTVGQPTSPAISAILFNTCDPFGLANNGGLGQLTSVADPATGNNCALAWLPDGALIPQREFTTAFQSVPYVSGNIWAFNTELGLPVVVQNTTIDPVTGTISTSKLKASAYISVGTKFTSNAGCTEGTLVGGATAGKFTVGQNTACTIIITMGDTATAPTGWSCWASDQTAVPAVAIRQTASNATTASLLMTVATNDVVSFGCNGY